MAHRLLHDERLKQAYVTCPDDETPMVPTGDAYSNEEAGTSWTIAFRCPKHPGEIIRVWRPAVQPLLEEVLRGVDVAALPLVGPNLQP